MFVFKAIYQKIKEALYKMGLIKGVKSISQTADIPVNDEFYEEIEKWKSVYSGYYDQWHKVKYHTIEGQKTRIMQSLNMPKMVAQEMAGLIYNEKCQVNISDDALNEYIDEIFKKNRFDKNYQDYLEYMFALGGMVVKPYYEDDRIKLSFVSADCFIPTGWDNVGVNEGVFYSETRKGKYKYTLLEFHMWVVDEGVKKYLVKNELYKADTQRGETGIKVPLDELYPDLEEEVYFENFERPLFVYTKPNTANNIDLNSPLGIPLFANSMDTLKSLDIAFDSFQREFTLGRKRILVPASAIKVVIDPESGQPRRYFDSSDEVYQAMNIGGMDSDKIEDISVEIRVEEHVAGIQALLKILAMQTGFSSGAFSFDASGLKTATEVVSENSKTFRTKQSHETNVEAGIQELVASILQLSEAYGLYSAPEDYEVSVAFDDSIAEDRTTQINEQITLVGAGLQSKKRALMDIFGLTDKEAEELLKEISEENAQAVSEQIDFFSMEGSNKQQPPQGSQEPQEGEEEEEGDN